jgi:hypothetical protein
MTGQGIPLALVDAFVETTAYRFTINVIPQDGPDKVITVEINWAGKWNTISGRVV